MNMMELFKISKSFQTMNDEQVSYYTILYRIYINYINIIIFISMFCLLSVLLYTGMYIWTYVENSFGSSRS